MADKEDLPSSSPTPPSPQTSLQELCEEKYLSHCLWSDSAVSEFSSLEPRLQQILFGSLRKQHARLIEKADKWDHLTRFCPHIDSQIHLTRARAEPGDGLDEENGYNQRQKFVNTWSYISEDDDGSEIESVGDVEGSLSGGLYGGRKAIRDISWHTYDLIRESPELELKLVDRSLSARRSYSSTWCDGFWHQISSQLLLYRLTVVFGMPPPKETDGYKSCWEIDLKHRDGASVLSFEDYKGGASTSFRGTSDASCDALKFINFLIGMNCQHSYDGVLAGTVA